MRHEREVVSLFLEFGNLLIIFGKDDDRARVMGNILCVCRGARWINGGRSSARGVDREVDE